RISCHCLYTRVQLQANTYYPPFSCRKIERPLEAGVIEGGPGVCPLSNRLLRGMADAREGDSSDSASSPLASVTSALDLPLGCICCGLVLTADSYSNSRLALLLRPRFD